MTKKAFRKIYSIFPKPVEKLFLRLENMIIYVFYGVLATIVNYAVHFGVRIAFADIPPAEELSYRTVMDAIENSAVSSAGASSIAWAAALVFAFFCNKFFVFESKGGSAANTFREFFTFAGGRIFSYGCEVLIMFVCVDVNHFNELIVKLLCNILVMVLNYIVSRLFVFRKAK